MSCIQCFGSGLIIADFVCDYKRQGCGSGCFLGSGSGFGNKVSSGYGFKNMVGLENSGWTG